MKKVTFSTLAILIFCSVSAQKSLSELAILPKKTKKITNVNTKAFDQVMMRYASLLVKNLRSDYAGK